MHADIGNDSAGGDDILAGDEARRHPDGFDGGLNPATVGHFHVAPNRADICRRLSSIPIHDDLRNLIFIMKSVIRALPGADELIVTRRSDLIAPRRTAYYGR